MAPQCKGRNIERRSARECLRFISFFSTELPIIIYILQNDASQAFIHVNEALVHNMIQE